MEIGASGYIHADYIAVTKSAICILRDAEWTPLDEFDDEEAEKEYIMIIRHGEGLTGEDFDIDVSNCDFDFKVMPEKYLNGSEDAYVIFPYDAMQDIKKVEDDLQAEMESGPLVNLYVALEQALEAEDYIKAQGIRNQIAELEKKEKDEKVE